MDVVPDSAKENIAKNVVDAGVNKLFEDNTIQNKIPTTCKKYFSAAFYRTYFRVSTKEVLTRLKLCLKPPILRESTTEFYTRIHNNPDFYGPFWLIVTWWMVLFIGMAINSMETSGFTGASIDMVAFAGSLKSFFMFGLGIPLLICIVLRVFGTKDKVNYSTNICIYGYA